MIFRFRVQGSVDEPYDIAIERVGDSLRASCTCAAGQNGQYCKHRMSLLQGSIQGVVSGDLEAIPRLPALLDGSDVAAALGRLAESERQLEQAKRAVSAAKRAIAQALRS